MAKPSFTESLYMSELDFQIDARKYYQERAKMLESLYRELIEDYDNINSAFIEDNSIQTDEDLKEHKEDIREMLKAIEG